LRHNFYKVITYKQKKSHLLSIPLKMCLPSTRKAYLETCHIKGVITTFNTEVTWSWNKAPNSIRQCVSKLYVNLFLWCCNQTEGQGDFLLRFPDHTHTHTHTKKHTHTHTDKKTDTDTLGRIRPNERSARRRSPLTTQHTTRERKFHALIGIQTHDPTKETDADIHVKPVSYRNRRSHIAFCHCFCADTLT
jgi:hypothetical protein